MPWFWTDDLADLLIEQEGVRPESLTEWKQRPVAISVPDNAEPLEVARALLGVGSEAVA